MRIFNSSGPIEHFGQYFNKVVDPETKQSEYVFDWGALKVVHKSFLDSLIVELCLPDSPIPKPVLYQLLHEAMEETPRDAKQFSQAVWDAVGDLSVGSINCRAGAATNALLTNRATDRLGYS